MQVREVMTRDVEIADPGDSIRKAAKAMEEHDTGVLPVGENDRLVGMVTDRDITIRCVAGGMDPDKATVRDVMSAAIHCCGEDDSIDRAADHMAELQLRRLPVINRDKRLVGIVSLGDIAKTDGQAQSASARALHDIAQPSAQHSSA